jgi:gas vesicle protein
MSNERVYYSHEAEALAMRERTVQVLIFLAIGLGIGTGLALLFAPTTGKQVRDDLTESAEKSWNRGQDAIDPVIKRLEEEFAGLRKQVEERLK